MCITDGQVEGLNPQIFGGVLPFIHTTSLMNKLLVGRAILRDNSEKRVLKDHEEWY